MREEVTHYGYFNLPSGSCLFVARTPQAWLLRARLPNGEHPAIVLTHTAAEIVAAAILRTREQRRPLPAVNLFRTESVPLHERNQTSTTP